MSKKVLLVNPKLPQKAVRLNIPLSLLYLGTWLSRKGYEVNILDAFNHNGNRHFYDRLREELNDGVLAVGLSVMTAQIASAMDISKFVREVDGSIPIIWGGVHPTLYPEQVAGVDYVDYAVKGEGEVIAVELLEAIDGENDGFPPLLKHIKGIAFRDACNKVVVNPDREPMDMDELSCPDLNLVEDVRTVGDIGEVTQWVEIGLPLVTSRGCPHLCKFCINSVTKSKYRLRRVDLVVRDIEEMIDQGATQICFMDEDFFANKKRMVVILEGIEKQGLEFKWFGSARADYFGNNRINFGLLRRMRKDGCQQLALGIESGSQRVLDMIKKGITVEQSIRAAEMINEAGIDATFSYMTGLPDETVNEVRQTVRLSARIAGLNDHFRTIGPFVFRPYAGSELQRRCVELGMREPQSLVEWASSPYIGETIDPKDYPLFPWVQYPMRDLIKLNFYAWMAGLRVKWGWLTRIVRRVGGWRCGRMWFGFPAEMWLLDAFRKLGFDRVITKGKFD